MNNKIQCLLFKWSKHWKINPPKQNKKIPFNMKVTKGKPQHKNQCTKI